VTAPKEIITAHHLNDYVESYLLNCFRGHPNHTPIEFFSEFNIEDKKYFDGKYYKIIHPFLLSTKRDFRQYLERNNYMKYVVEDETNVENKGSRRNWLRNIIIPEMKKNKISLEKFAKNKINSRLQLESFVVNS
jgi:tRNA(Ile)-lysidine synthase TilS/MesJ